MSASSEKKRRQAEREQGIDKRAQAQREAEEQAKKSSLKYRLAMIGIALFVVLAIILNTTLPFKMTAVKVNDTAYSAAEMNYFYGNAYYEAYQYMSMFGVNPNAPLESQNCPLLEDGSWKDYLVENATESARGMEALYQTAIADGYVLSEAGVKNVEDSMVSLAEYAEEYGFKNPNEYLEAAYGTGVTEEIVREMMTMGTVVNEYTAAMGESFTYTEDELNAYYDEHSDTFYTYDFAYYYIAAETEEVTDEEGNVSNKPVEGGAEKALADAASLGAKITDRASFDAAVAEYKEDAKVTESNHSLKSSMVSVYADWMTSADRKTGDLESFGTENGAYLVMFLGMNDNKYPTAAMRHVLVMTEDTDGDGVYSADEMAVAEAAIKEIEAKWLAGEQTEEAFAALAEEFSEDEGSKLNGGLYDGIGEGNMVSEIDSFLFEGNRKAGDIVIVHGNNGYYDGYHLVYFVGEGESYHLTLAEDALRNEDYSEWQAGILEGYTVTKGLGHNLIGK